VNRELYQDIEAAKILGMETDSLGLNMVNRGEGRAFGFLNEGLFRPLTVSREVQGLFQTKADDLGLPNPFEQAADALAGIAEILSETSLEGDLFPDLINPFDTSILPDVVGQVNNMLGTNTAVAGANPSGFVGQGNVNINQAQAAQNFEALYPGDTLGNRYMQKKTNQNQTKLR